MTVTKRVLRIGLVLLLATLWSAAAGAQPLQPEARVAAQALFEEGKRLMEEGEHQAACIKFEESHALDPAIGTMFRLADCFERIDRLASAWVLFVDAAALARSGGRPDREQVARQRAAELEPRLNHMVVTVDKPFEGLVVKRNGTRVGPGQWDTRVPVDAGEHAVTARAQSHHPWRRTVRIRGEGKVVRVTVPALRPLPIEVRPSPTEPAPVPEPSTADGISLRGAVAIAMGVIGVVGLGVGTAAGIVAIDKTSESERFCPEADGCFDRGLALREEARRAAAVSTVSFAIGGSALLSGLILWLAIPNDPDPRGSAWGVTIQGTW